MYLVVALLAVLIIFGGLYLFQEKLLFFPQKLDPSYRFSFRQNFQERYFNMADGVRIHALHFRVREPVGIVYYLHGNAGSLLGWGSVAEDFTRFQYDVLMIDYRGYGKSNGKITEQGMLNDALAIYDTLGKEYQENDIVVYGRSLGTGIASWITSQRDPRMLILESPYYNIPDAARSSFPWFPSFLVRFKFRNDLYLKNTQCPVYIFHGDQDEVINIKGSYKLQPLLKPGDSLYIIEGGHHNDLALFGEYQQKVREILR